ncbi:hypothetical protein GCM10007160_15440 [Litchfieldella qijiaojingensis]|uniref:DUF2167 domain-containing protein n=1 Tax=Litchfieldella qijiaojingensis TaxID=980347 RepID=A0ABQ2YMU3_9GAMM|nr:DUF2167 domain-containing protein [Halomonas qijiaojingensis]GGX89019.1 hypothetical protein GCM10007160_15440 [Halomonas qijiaojingensis]
MKNQYLLLFFSLVVSSFAYALDESEVIGRIQALDWNYEPAEYTLENEKSSVATSFGDYILIGSEAHKYMRITEGHSGFKPDAVVVRVDGSNQDAQVTYTFHDIGYVKMDDWDEHIDPKEMLDQIKKSTLESNEIREAGYPDIFVDDWVEEPYLDEHSATAYWAISGHTGDGNSFVNAKALKLGRHGYTEIVWMGRREQFSSAENSLAPSLAAYSYKEGFQYADYIPGADKMAAVGVGALAYKLITGNAAAKVGAGLLAMLVLFAKKLWFVIFLPFIFLWKKIKSRFSRSNFDE